MQELPELTQGDAPPPTPLLGPLRLISGLGSQFLFIGQCRSLFSDPGELDSAQRAKGVSLRDQASRPASGVSSLLVWRALSSISPPPSLSLPGQADRQGAEMKLDLCQ